MTVYLIWQIVSVPKLIGVANTMEIAKRSIQISYSGTKHKTECINLGENISQITLTFENSPEQIYQIESQTVMESPEHL